MRLTGYLYNTVGGDYQTVTVRVGGMTDEQLRSLPIGAVATLDLDAEYDAPPKREEMTDEMETAEARFIAAQREYEDAFEAVERLRIAEGREPLSAELRRLALEDLAAEDLATGLDDRGEQGSEGEGDSDSGADADSHDGAPSASVIEGDDDAMVADVVKVLQVKTISSSALAACPAHVLVPSHYRPDGTCLHDLREREPVIFHAGYLDQDVREAYNGQKAVILQRIDSDRMDSPDFLIEFASGNRLTVFAAEVEPDA